jgi:heterotetrameric sarcosine oxidase gamma subunit
VPDLTPLSAFGLTAPRAVVHGPLSLNEVSGLALASLAITRGDKAPRLLDLSLPDVGGLVQQGDMFAFWTGPDQWMLAYPEAGDFLASDNCAVTDQTDGWVILDLCAPDGTALERVLEKLVNLDLRVFPAGQARRTGLAHLSVFVLRRDVASVRILGPRSAAGTLWHAVETVLRLHSAPLHT